MTDTMADQIKIALFDFGGVMAEEGFREGLKAIGRTHGLDPEAFFHTAAALTARTGYLTGTAREEEYWHALRQDTGIKGTDRELRMEILDRFVLRPWMVDLVRKLRSKVPDVSMLSDQTNWLDELNERDDFFKEFDHIFNSYHLGKSKSDPTIFTDVASNLGAEPGSILFVDDNEGHIQRARSGGIRTIHFQSGEALANELERMGLLG